MSCARTGCRFQSTPAITDERACLPRVPATGSASFNPRPPLLASEPPGVQSARPAPSCFNPRPPLLASEPGPGLPVQEADHVSIHARHYWRASLSACFLIETWLTVSIHARHYWRASHPALGGCCASEAVSIHARHYWRASRRKYLCQAGGRSVSIHARHYWRASPTTGVRKGVDEVFQSTPAITGERAHGRQVLVCAARSFNPRPPLLASEPHRDRYARYCDDCFNPRPPLLASEP